MPVIRRELYAKGTGVANMAQMKPGKVFVSKVKKVLTDTLGHAGIRAKVFVKSSVSGLPLKRVYVVAKEFDKMRGSERHDFVWRALEDGLTRDERFFISMVAILTPDEYEEMCAAFKQGTKRRGKRTK